MWSYSNHMWGGGVFGMVIMILFWILLIVALVAAIRYFQSSRRETGAPVTKTPLQILQERYARGEIDRTEYQEKKRDLESHA